MPTYDYLCQTCSHRFETWQKMTDEPLTSCPECGSHIRRVLYPAGVVFKGSGFYKTDHGNGSLAGKTDGTNGTKKADDASTEKKASSESKTTEGGSHGKTSEPTGTASKVA